MMMEAYAALFLAAAGAGIATQLVSTAATHAQRTREEKIAMLEAANALERLRFDSSRWPSAQAETALPVSDIASRKLAECRLSVRALGPDMNNPADAPYQSDRAIRLEITWQPKSGGAKVVRSVLAWLPEDVVRTVAAPPTSPTAEEPST